ncbi:MAG TPA: hypothetical protein VFJ52_09210 [Terriglobia bacterium]|nr:hypothetical protein [Terriglobia bacterium]
MDQFKMTKWALILAAALLLAPQAWARSHNQALFKYVAGTESLPRDCVGKLEVTESELVFQCAGKSLSVPYSDITKMEFQPRVSKKIRKMKLAWTLKPTSTRGKHEGFFTVIYRASNETRAIILRVRNETMRPYLAEIDLRTGRPIESRQD